MRNIVRNTHKYLSFFISLQLFLWTISGIYFAFNKIELVRGEQYRLTESFPINFDEVNEEIATIKGRLDGLEAQQNDIEAGSFNDTTTMNGKAIFDTQTWDQYGEGPTKMNVSGPFSDNKDKIKYTANDFRFTTKGNKPK